MPKAEGKLFDWDGPEKIKTDYLESFEFDCPKELITIDTNELSAVCPFSGLPDIARLIIEYLPKGRKCIELKSFKYYLVSFRNVGLYQEGVTKRIYEDMKKVLDTDSLTVTTIYNTRGGINVSCTLGELN